MKNKIKKACLSLGWIDAALWAVPVAVLLMFNLVR